MRDLPRFQRTPTCRQATVWKTFPVLAAWHPISIQSRRRVYWWNNLLAHRPFQIECSWVAFFDLCLPVRIQASLCGLFPDLYLNFPAIVLPPQLAILLLRSHSLYFITTNCSHWHTNTRTHSLTRPRHSFHMNFNAALISIFSSILRDHYRYGLWTFCSKWNVSRMRILKAITIKCRHVLIYKNMCRYCAWLTFWYNVILWLVIQVLLQWTAHVVMVIS